MPPPIPEEDGAAAGTLGAGFYVCGITPLDLLGGAILPPPRM